MTTITLYKPGGEVLGRFKSPTDVEFKNGALTFYWTKETSGVTKKVVTTVPFMIQEDIGGA